MKKYKHIPTERVFKTELIGHNKVEGIVWGDWQIPMWVVENNCDWQEITEPKKVILITEDKVGLCEGDTYYVPQRRDKDTLRGEVVEFTLGVEGYIQNKVLRFSSRENAKAYIKKYQNYTTTDGHGIRKGDEFYIYDAKRHTYQRGEFGHFTDSKFNGKRFRTKEEVENLIKLNKKQYSLSDIRGALQATLPLGLAYKNWENDFTKDFEEYLSK